MTALLFILVLAVLVLVHEWGHFITAKMTHTRVDAFGIGFPPKLFSWKPKKSETTYSINLIPFGGFVKILGEDGDRGIEEKDSHRSFTSKSKPAQVMMLAGGVIANALFAWIILSIGFMIGFPTAATDERGSDLLNPRLTIVNVAPDSPGEAAGLMPGDVFENIRRDDEELSGEALSPDRATEFIGESEVVSFTVLRGEEIIKVDVSPVEGIVPDRSVVGIGLSLVGIKKYAPVSAFIEGAKLTKELTVTLVVGFGDFFKNIFTGNANLKDIAGPVGIAGLIGDASALGLVPLLSFIAFISLNLAILNLLPFPALDGGRILFVLIETVKGSPIRPRIAQTFNTVGFALLILLMLVVTLHDVIRLIRG